MGDMADYYVDCAYANYEEDMQSGEAYGRSTRQYRPGYKYRNYQSPVCKSCGKSLAWGLSDKGNHMLCERDGFTPHKCSAESVFSAFAGVKIAAGVKPEQPKEVKQPEEDWLW